MYGVDQEQLSNKLFGAYSSHRYEPGLNEETYLLSDAFIDEKINQTKLKLQIS